MRNTNSVTITGRLGKTPELKETSNKVPVVDFNIANNRDYKNKDGETVARVNWIQCRAYRGLAETICKYLVQGAKITIIGELTTDTWEDKESGDLRSRTYVLVTEAEFHNGKSEGNEKSESSETDMSEIEHYAAVDEDVF